MWDEWTGYGWVLFVNGPTIDAINVLEAHWTQRMSICALHIAFEFDAINGVTREELVELIDFHFHVKRRRFSDEMFIPEGTQTQYSVDTALRRSRGQRKPSIVGSHTMTEPASLMEKSTLRYEVRLETGRAVKTRGFHIPADLLVAS